MTASINLPLASFYETTNNNATYGVTYTATPSSAGSFTGPAGSTAGTSSGSATLTFNVTPTTALSESSQVYFVVDNDEWPSIEIDVSITDGTYTKLWSTTYNSSNKHPISGIASPPTLTPVGAFHPHLNLTAAEGSGVALIPGTHLPNLADTGTPSGSATHSNVTLVWDWTGTGLIANVVPHCPNLTAGSTLVITTNGATLTCPSGVDFNTSVSNMGWLLQHDTVASTMSSAMTFTDTVHSLSQSYTWHLTVTDTAEATNHNGVTHNWDEDIAYNFSPAPQIADNTTDANTPDAYTVTLTSSLYWAGPTGTLSTSVSNSATKTWVYPTLTLSGTKADINAHLAALTFTPTVDYNSSFTITYTQTNPVTTGSSVPALVTTGSLTMAGVNSSDYSLTAIQYYFEDTTHTITGLAVTDVAVGKSYEVHITGPAAIGGLSASGSGGTFSTVTPGYAAVITGTKSEVNSYLSTLTVTPPADYTTSAVYNYYQEQTTDSIWHTPAIGSTPVSFTLQGIDSNEAQNHNASYTYVEDTAFILSPAPEIIDVATGKNYSVVLTVNNTAHASLSSTSGVWNAGAGTLTITGTKSVCNTNLANVTYTPLADITATVLITYVQTQTTDSITQASGTITVTNVSADTELSGATSVRTYHQRQHNNIFDSPALEITDNATGKSYRLDIALGNSSGEPSNIGTFDIPNYATQWTLVSDGTTLSPPYYDTVPVLRITGTKSEINDRLLDVEFIPATTNMTTDSILTYHQVQTTDGILQLNAFAVAFNGTAHSAYLENHTASHAYDEDTAYTWYPQQYFDAAATDVVLTMQMRDPAHNALAITSGANVVGVVEVITPALQVSASDVTAQTNWDGNTLTIGVSPGNDADTVYEILRNGIKFTPHADVDSSWELYINATDNTNSLSANGTSTFTGAGTSEYSITTPLSWTEDTTFSFGSSAPQVTDAAVGDNYTITMTFPTEAGTLRSVYAGVTTDSVNGTWATIGNKAFINGTLATLTFIPASNYDTNFNITYTQVRHAGTGNITQASDTIVMNATGIADSPYWDTSGSIGRAVEIVAFSYTFMALDPDTGDTLTYAIQSGSLPTGLSLASNGNLTGTVPSGTVSSATTYSFTVRVTDSTSRTADEAFTLQVVQTLAPQILVLSPTRYFNTSLITTYPIGAFAESEHPDTITYTQSGTTGTLSPASGSSGATPGILTTINASTISSPSAAATVTHSITDASGSTNTGTEVWTPYGYSATPSHIDGSTAPMALNTVDTTWHVTENNVVWLFDANNAGFGTAVGGATLFKFLPNTGSGAMTWTGIDCYQWLTNIDSLIPFYDDLLIGDSSANEFYKASDLWTNQALGSGYTPYNWSSYLSAGSGSTASGIHQSTNGMFKVKAEPNGVSYITSNGDLYVNAIFTVPNPVRGSTTTNFSGVEVIDFIRVNNNTWTFEKDTTTNEISIHYYYTSNLTKTAGDWVDLSSIIPAYSAGTGVRFLRAWDEPNNASTITGVSKGVEFSVSGVRTILENNYLDAPGTMITYTDGSVGTSETFKDDGPLVQFRAQDVYARNGTQVKTYNSTNYNVFNHSKVGTIPASGMLTSHIPINGWFPVGLDASNYWQRGSMFGPFKSGSNYYFYSL